MPGANSKVGRIGENEGRALGKALVQQPRLGSSRLHFQAIFWRLFLFLIAFYRTRQPTRRATMTGSTLYRFEVFVGDQQDRLHPWGLGSDGVKERVPVLCYCLVAGRRHRAT